MLRLCHMSSPSSHGFFVAVRPRFGGLCLSGKRKNPWISSMSTLTRFLQTSGHSMNHRTGPRSPRSRSLNGAIQSCMSLTTRRVIGRFFAGPRTMFMMGSWYAWVAPLITIVRLGICLTCRSDGSHGERAETILGSASLRGARRPARITEPTPFPRLGFVSG
jgi:hypothetical protein